MEDKKQFNDELAMDINADADIPGNTHLTNSGSDQTQELDKISEELQDQKEKYLRLVAEFDNYKRRTSRERIELSQSAGKEIISSLLEILDDVERAEKQWEVNSDTEQVTKGVSLIFNKLRSLLQQKGLVAMNSIDTDFDVEKHEAIAEVEVDDSKKGKVTAEVQKGYYLNDKILRFAKVVVGK